MRVRGLILSLVVLFGLPGLAWAQFKPVEPEGGGGGGTLGDAQSQQVQIGMTVTAVGGACRGIVGYAPVPDEWPEQQVSIVEEDISSGVKISYRQVDGMAKVMEVRIAQLADGEEAKALVTFEVRRSAILPPDDTDQYVLADASKFDRQMRGFLSPSPQIESSDRKIRDLAKQIVADEEKAWKKVEAIYDWVRDNIEYKNGSLKGAAAALRDGTGDCEEMTSLFIALCRANKIPARTVWVHNHCYPEFYLADAEGEGVWFPCQAAGSRAFGEMAEFRPILQKGDNVHPPYNRASTKRYMSEYLTGTGVGGDPRVKFTRTIVAQ